MKKMWHVILAVVLVMILLGIVGIAVGFLTGADASRIYQTAESNNLVSLIMRYYEWLVQVFNTYRTALFG
jgi:hypothetical protein